MFSDPILHQPIHSLKIKHMKNSDTYKELIRHENEITKLKIQAEFGINLENTGNLNPAIENIWLNQILEYERNLVNNKKITIEEFLENPVFREVEEITDEELTIELQKLMVLLQEKKMVVDSVSGVEDREMYRFITKELFRVETDNCLPKNMIVCYIYEEFHPNDEYDLKRYTKEFVNSLTNKDINLMQGFLLSENEEEKVKQENLLRRLNLFRNAFEKIELEEFEVSNLQIDSETAEVVFTYSYDVYLNEHGNGHQISNTGKIYFLKANEFWFIKDVDMKGVS
jgi:hypothetical protein